MSGILYLVLPIKNNSNIVDVNSVDFKKIQQSYESYLQYIEDSKLKNFCSKKIFYKVEKFPLKIVAQP